MFGKLFIIFLQFSPKFGTMFVVECKTHGGQRRTELHLVGLKKS